jgi:hypothetical protein
VELSPGQTICERFELVRAEPDGTGTPVLGARWAAFDLDSGDLVRLVFIAPELGGAGERRVALEARLAALMTIRDDSLAPVCFVGVEAGASVVAYEGLYGGIAVAEVFGDLSAEERSAEHLRFAVELARGQRALHRGGLVQAIHGIEIVFDWERGYAVWCYGLADVCEPVAIRARCQEHGVALAPEVAAGGPFTPRADVFGWAASVVAFVTGTRPVEAIELARSGALSGVDARLQPLLLRCLAASPTERLADGDGLIQELATAGLIEDESPSSLPEPDPAPSDSLLPPATAVSGAEAPAPIASALEERPRVSSLLEGIAGLDLPPPPGAPDLLDLPPLPPLPGEFGEPSSARSGASALSASIDAAIAPVGAAVDAALGLGAPRPSATSPEPEKKRPEARPAPAVIVKPAKPAPSPPPPAGSTGKVRVLGAPIEAARAETKSATEAPTTASLVSAALASGRVTPPPTDLAGKAEALGEPRAPAAKREADAATSRAAPVSSKAAAAASVEGGREPDAPVLRRDRRTHPLGWAVQSEPVAAAAAPSAEVAATKASADASSSGLVDTQAIVEATSLPVQPGVVVPAPDKSSHVQLLLLFLAASLLILAIFIYGS